MPAKGEVVNQMLHHGRSAVWAAVAAAMIALALLAPPADAQAPEPTPDTPGSAFVGGGEVEEPGLGAKALAASAIPCEGDEHTALLQDNVPWFAPVGLNPQGANAHELQAQGSPFCILLSTELGTLDLGGFERIVISSAQSATFYGNLFPSGVVHDDLDAWVRSGGLLIANLTDCASGPGNGGTWASVECGATAGSSFQFVGGVRHVSATTNDNSFADRDHAVISGQVDCPSGHCSPILDLGFQEDLDGWNLSSHGYFVDLPAGTEVVLSQPDEDGDGLSEPVIIDYPHGGGRVLASQVTAEWRYGGNFSGFTNRKLLANVLAFRGGKVITHDGPNPLLAAHGITGVADDMNNVLAFAHNTVPLLSHSQSANTGRVTSVWTNGDQISREAAQLLADSGAERVNLIAHSKGGLDARVAMWENFQLFETLGMLATPNGGSEGADRLCALRRADIDFVSGDMGPCDGPEDALYNLQTGYMRDVFNVEIRDWGNHNHDVVAGDCTGGFLPSVCKLANGVAMGGVLGCEKGGDMAVCVESAFARSRLLSDGIHNALDPVFDLDHTEMRESPCPNARLLAMMYSDHNLGNPFVGGNGEGCEDMRFGVGFQALAAPSEPDAATSERDLGPLVDQQLVPVAVPTEGTSLPLDPEGGDVMRVAVFADDGLALEVRTPDGDIDGQARIEEADFFGVPITLITLRDLQGSQRDLWLSAPVPQVIGVVTQVTPGEVVVSATAEPDGPGLARITAVIDGVNLGEARRYRVTARIPGQQETVDVPLDHEPQPGAAGRFSAVVPVPAGEYLPIDVLVQGAHHRAVSTGLVLPDGSGTIDGLNGEDLLDSDGDGVVDVWSIRTAVTLGEPGEYHLSVDLHSAAGDLVLSAPGNGLLDAGSGEIAVHVPLRALHSAGIDGPFDVRSATLSRGEFRTRVAEKAFVGRTGPLDLAEVPTAEMVVGRPQVSTTDEDRDGLLDRLTFASIVTSPQAGEYTVSGYLTGPDGSRLHEHRETLSLAAGQNTLIIAFPGDLIGSNGSGVYSLSDLRIVDGTTGEILATLRSAPSGPLDASEWLGGPATIETLIRSWDREREAGEIPGTGLYTSERQRLERIRQHVGDGDVAAARSELDRFLAHVEQQTPAAISDAASTRIRAYAARVSQGLPGD